MKLSSTLNLNPLTFQSKFKFTLSILNSFSFSSLSNHDTTQCNRNFNNNAIDRILLRIRTLSELSNHHHDEPTRTLPPHQFLQRQWLRSDDAIFPSENNEERVLKKKKKKNEVMAQCLAEEELNRLRTIGMHLKEKISIPKSGLTRPVLHKIHHQWNNNELVKLKFHEFLSQNMNLAHNIVQRRTGGIVIWRSGSVMWVYRGDNYQGPTTNTKHNSKSESVVWNQQQHDNMTPEEMEFNRMLDGLGPRFVDWWGTGILPVDADLLSPIVPGYTTPLRLLPTKMHPRLTNDEHAKMLKLAKALPCHFALGRNRNLQGLACAILKLWEKSLVAKIAVKLGVQNTNNELMALELKKLTGGTLLLRNKYYIVIYRGKDFVPANVAAILSERQQLMKQVQDVQKKVRCRAIDVTGENEINTQAGLSYEFNEAQAFRGGEVSPVECEKMMKEAAEASNVRLMKKMERKLVVIHEEADVKIDASLVPASPDNRREKITDEERVMFRVVGLKMKVYLQLGTRVVFDGVIENMHLHWRHRELVKLITREKNLAFVEEIAGLLEYKSGGILAAIDRLPKGFSLIYYRGKSYRRPITLRPRNPLMKAKALQCSTSMQRHESEDEGLSSR
ncbi:CRM-domain containing factor CFM3, chloroplastic/mitochondrial-like [Vicia villosa]|uniref:CRM-domain containing factor CFM3, chloroplastic/mitochondrial-like n=1 Tax=Vicia villosa TaxID=3911 RepID=UPI00273C2E54|nr:CRM-domain containing factor CFM3, chloroplastic/mitochondrial-like [Vicia villosa]XP_058757804.1 CRM-domain containing factor CFM3, chloroplastic/mitochondrial-like [Vicia villosa]